MRVYEMIGGLNWDAVPGALRWNLGMVTGGERLVVVPQHGQGVLGRVDVTLDEGGGLRVAWRSGGEVRAFATVEGAAVALEAWLAALRRGAADAWSSLWTAQFRFEPVRGFVPSGSDLERHTHHLDAEGLARLLHHDFYIPFCRGFSHAYAAEHFGGLAWEQVMAPVTAADVELRPDPGLPGRRRPNAVALHFTALDDWVAVWDEGYGVSYTAGSGVLC